MHEASRRMPAPWIPGVPGNARGRYRGPVARVFLEFFFLLRKLGIFLKHGDLNKIGSISGCPEKRDVSGCQTFFTYFENFSVSRRVPS